MAAVLILLAIIVCLLVLILLVLMGTRDLVGVILDDLRKRRDKHGNPITPDNRPPLLIDTIQPKGPRRDPTEF